VRLLVALVLVLVLVACGSGSSDVVESSGPTTASPSIVETTVAPGSYAPSSTTSTSLGTTSVGTSSSTSEPSQEELAVFIAAMEDLLVGTVYEGEAISQPELFLATGWLFCDWLDAGDEPDVVLSRYLDELAGGVDVATDDQLVLAGALLGAAVAVLCPSHAASVG
jgi:hypothetical protein